jgi:putative flippase GtrA
MHRFWSFQSKGNARRQVFLYTILFFINLTAISLLMYVFTDMFGIHPMISKVLVMGAVVSWNFILYKKVIYR